VYAYGLECVHWTKEIKLLESAKSKGIELEGSAGLILALMHSCFHGLHLVEETK
jgi:hypothetical protein